MSQTKTSMEYEIPQLKEDFPVLSERSIPDITLFPLVGILFEKFRKHLDENSTRIGITHVRVTSDPHFACRTSEMVVHGRIIDITVPYNYIDTKDYCGMPCRIVLTSHISDLPIIENLMMQFRKIARKQDVEALKKEVLEHIKKFLRDDAHLSLGQIYSCVRNFYGDYELRKFEDELCRERQNASA